MVGPILHYNTRAEAFPFMRPRGSDQLVDVGCMTSARLSLRPLLWPNGIHVETPLGMELTLPVASLVSELACAFARVLWNEAGVSGHS